MKGRAKWVDVIIGALIFHSKRLNFFIPLLSFQLAVYNSSAQNSLISGKIMDVRTNEPISYVNIHIKDTNFGTITDSVGNFTIVIIPQPSILEISVLGYERKFVKINPATTKFISVDLKPTDMLLKEVVVKPPKKRKRIIDTAALYVFARVMENKPRNNPDAVPNYYLHEYTKMITSMIHASPKLLNSKLLKPFGFFFEERDTTASGEEYIPLIILEEYNETYHRNKPFLNRKVIYYRHMSGFKKTFLANYISDQLKYIDIYKNVYVIAGKAFTSPFSPQARTTYTYHILDTIRINNSVTYTLNFVAKNKEDVALKGCALIDSATWGIAAIYFNPNEKANVNFLTDYSVEQKFEQTDSGWIMNYEKVNARGNLLQKRQKLAIYITKITARDSIQLNHSIPDSVSKAPDDIIVNKAFNRHRSFLDTLRLMPLDKAEQHIYHSFDTALTVKAFKRLQWLGKLVTSANFRAGPFDFGRAFYFVSRNAVEGYRIRLGVFTNEYFSQTVHLYAQGAYGFKDKKWKYEVDMRFNFPRRYNRWSQLWLQSKNDMVVLGQDNPQLTYDNILTLLSPATKKNKVMRLSVQSIQYQIDWFKGLSSNFGIAFKRWYSTDQGIVFDEYRDNTFKPLTGFNSTELSAELRYCANDQYTKSYGFRFFIPTTKPSFTLKYTWRIKNPLFGYFGSHSLQAIVKQVIYMPVIGYGKLDATAGYIFGEAPYPTSFISSANIGILRDEASYQLTKLFEFGHDKYVSLWYEHHFEGLLFNHIPYLKKVKLREFISVKALWGNMSTKNKNILLLPVEMHTASKKPYVEIGFGVENILKLLQVSFTWRTTYRNEIGAQNFVFKINVRPSF